MGLRLRFLPFRKPRFLRASVRVAPGVSVGVTPSRSPRTNGESSSSFRFIPFLIGAVLFFGGCVYFISR